MGGYGILLLTFSKMGILLSSLHQCIAIVNVFKDGYNILIFSLSLSLSLLTRCLVESRWERSVSSFIHGGKYLKVAEKLLLIQTREEILTLNLKIWLLL